MTEHEIPDIDINGVSLREPLDGVPECAEHGKPHYDEKCAACIGESDQKNAVLAALNKGIVDSVNAIARNGQSINPAMPHEVRLQLLIDSVFDGRQRMHFEIEGARRMNEILVRAKQEATKASLVVPGSSKGGLHIAKG